MFTVKPTEKMTTTLLLDTTKTSPVVDTTIPTTTVQTSTSHIETWSFEKELDDTSIISGNSFYSTLKWKRMTIGIKVNEKYLPVLRYPYLNDFWNLIRINNLPKEFQFVFTVQKTFNSNIKVNIGIDQVQFHSKGFCNGASNDMQELNNINCNFKLNTCGYYTQFSYKLTAGLTWHRDIYRGQYVLAAYPLYTTHESLETKLYSPKFKLHKDNCLRISGTRIKGATIILNINMYNPNGISAPLKNIVFNKHTPDTVGYIEIPKIYVQFSISPLKSDDKPSLLFIISISLLNDSCPVKRNDATFEKKLCSFDKDIYTEAYLLANAQDGVHSNDVAIVESPLISDTGYTCLYYSYTISAVHNTIIAISVNILDSNNTFRTLSSVEKATNSAWYTKRTDIFSDISYKIIIKAAILSKGRYAHIRIDNIGTSRSRCYKDEYYKVSPTCDFNKDLCGYELANKLESSFEWDRSKLNTTTDNIALRVVQSEYTSGDVATLISPEIGIKNSNKCVYFDTYFINEKYIVSNETFLRVYQLLDDNRNRENILNISRNTCYKRYYINLTKHVSKIIFEATSVSKNEETFFIDNILFKTGNCVEENEAMCTFENGICYEYSVKTTHNDNWIWKIEDESDFLGFQLLKCNKIISVRDNSASINSATTLTTSYINATKNHCISFNFHGGRYQRPLMVYIEVENGIVSCSYRVRQLDKIWKVGYILDLPQTNAFRIHFKAVKGGFKDEIFAIDDLKFADKEVCQNFTNNHMNSIDCRFQNDMCGYSTNEALYQGFSWFKYAIGENHHLRIQGYNNDTTDQIARLISPKMINPISKGKCLYLNLKNKYKHSEVFIKTYFKFINETFWSIPEQKYKDSCNFNSIIYYHIDKPVVQVMLEIKSLDIKNNIITLNTINVEYCNGNGNYSDNRNCEEDSLKDKLTLGSNKIQSSDLSWQVSLELQDYESFSQKCSGTIVHNRYILTPAKCISRNTDRIIIRFAKSSIPVEVIHKKDIVFYASKYEFLNVAIIRLPRSLIANFPINPICLPKTTVLLNESSQCFHVELMNNGTNLINWRKVIERNECNRVMGNTTDRPNFVCASSKNPSNKTTESYCKVKGFGDPLICLINDKWLLFGIKNWIPSICEWDFNVYSHISSNLEWINRSIDRDLKCTESCVIPKDFLLFCDFDDSICGFVVKSYPNNDIVKWTRSVTQAEDNCPESFLMAQVLKVSAQSVALAELPVVDLIGDLCLIFKYKIKQLVDSTVSLSVYIKFDENEPIPLIFFDKNTNNLWKKSEIRINNNSKFKIIFKASLNYENTNYILLDKVGIREGICPNSPLTSTDNSIDCEFQNGMCGYSLKNNLKSPFEWQYVKISTELNKYGLKLTSFTGHSESVTEILSSLIQPSQNEKCLSINIYGKNRLSYLKNIIHELYVKENDKIRKYRNLCNWDVKMSIGGNVTQIILKAKLKSNYFREDIFIDNIKIRNVPYHLFCTFEQDLCNYTIVQYNVGESKKFVWEIKEIEECSRGNKVLAPRSFVGSRGDTTTATTPIVNNDRNLCLFYKYQLTSYYSKISLTVYVKEENGKITPLNFHVENTAPNWKAGETYLPSGNISIIFKSILYAQYGSNVMIDDIEFRSCNLIRPNEKNDSLSCDFNNGMCGYEFEVDFSSSIEWHLVETQKKNSVIRLINVYNSKKKQIRLFSPKIQPSREERCLFFQMHHIVENDQQFSPFFVVYVYQRTSEEENLKFFSEIQSNKGCNHFIQLRENVVQFSFEVQGQLLKEEITLHLDNFNLIYSKCPNDLTNDLHYCDFSSDNCNNSYMMVDSVDGYPNEVTVLRSPLINKVEEACLIFDYKMPNKLQGSTLSVYIQYENKELDYIISYNHFTNDDWIKERLILKPKRIYQVLFKVIQFQLFSGNIYIDNIIISKSECHNPSNFGYDSKNII
ncbi:DgyrCDS5264 [Dimorphilus gyrociliatus]|uniref:DgyrCDS5264 n=1 Tax=Dimorphilus gyrociliatus TaxID=2664684 RepID=A0A7I8VJB1_9ANNE|nr:DgyrCDS5264 [Dimorphilus gyrociliatus]